MITIPRSLAMRIRDLVGNAKRVGVVFHRNPDGDSIGAGLALALMVTARGIPVTLYCITGTARVFAKLPLISETHTDPEIFEREPCDVVIVLDAGDAAFAGIAGIKALEDVTVINIDHHPTNTRYGTVNLVVPQASSTAEVVYALVSGWGEKITPDMATVLLLGFLNDTDEFSNPATTASALVAASALIQSGANYEIARQCLRVGKRMSALPVWGKVFSSLEHNAETGVVRAVVAQEMLGNVHASAIEGIPNFLNCLRDAHMTMVVKEQSNGTVHCSFRTVRDDIDVGELAQRLGGGGHRKAAGFSVVGRLEKESDGRYSLKEEPK